MTTLTIVDAYLAAALKRAEFERTEGGAICATVPGFAGVIAFGDTLQACVAGLIDRLEDFVLVGLQEGIVDMPVLDGIDPNTADRASLGQYDGKRGSEVRREFYEDEAAFEAALAALDREDEEQHRA